METFIEAWNLICDYLKNQIPEVSYNLWIGKIEPVNLDFSSGSVVLKVPTPFHRDIIMKSYQNNLKEAFNNVLGSEFQIDILTEDQMELQEESKEEFILCQNDSFLRRLLHGISRCFFCFF